MFNQYLNKIDEVFNQQDYHMERLESLYRSAQDKDEFIYAIMFYCLQQNNVLKNKGEVA